MTGWAGREGGGIICGGIGDGGDTVGRQDLWSNYVVLLVLGVEKCGVVWQQAWIKMSAF